MNRFELDKNAFSRGLGRSVNMLIEISHSAFDEPFYFINDTKPLEVDGKTYQPYPFDIVLPNQTETQGTQLVLSNVNNLASRQIKKTINSDENIIVNLMLVNIEQDEAQTYTVGDFEITSANANLEAITCNINIRNCFDINLGAIRFNRELFTNLYK